MNRIWWLLKPNLTKILLMLLLPFIIGYILTLSLDQAIGLYCWMLTPTFEIQADPAQQIFNQFVLLWIPFYIISCIIISGISRIRSS
ncbi:MAG: hypothetical protein NTX81_04100 [Candidatus Bathyarchaeota archaeon]|nr:hypothetical protein [Candidatus Bathyarchaeota archaeon]